MKLQWNKDGSMQIPNGFRVLRDDELIQQWDMWPDEEHGVWQHSTFRWRAGLTANEAIFIREEKQNET